LTFKQSLPELLVPLTPPRWVAAFSFVLLSLGACALVISARWAGMSPWLAITLAPIPFLVHFIGRWHNQTSLRGRVLVVSPDKPWQLAFFSEVAGLTDSLEVIVSQRWQHLFGITLGLKLQHCPHNMSKTVTMMVWRECVSTSVFHEVALQSARQIDDVARQTKGDAA
jgi:hypothetical protein